MEVSLFNERIAAARTRLAALARQAADMPPQCQGLVGEAVGEVMAMLQGLQPPEQRTPDGQWPEDGPTVGLQQAYEELQVAEEELRQQNEELLAARHTVEFEQQRYQNLFDFAPDGYLVTNERGIIQEANRAAATLLGVSQQHLIGKSLALYVSSQDRQALRRQLSQFLAGAEDETVRLGIQMQPRASEVFDAALTLAFVPARDDHAAVLRCQIRDVTEQKKTEAERERLLAENRDQRAFLASLVESAPVGVAVISGPDHRYELVNPRYQAIPGSRVEPAAGRTLTEVFPQIIESGGLDAIEEVYRTGQPIHVRERPARVEAGQEPAYWDVDFMPLEGSKGRVERILLLTRDVTDQVLIRRQVEELAIRSRQRAEELDAVFDSLTDAVVVYDAAGTAVKANPAAITAFGLDPVGESQATLAQKLPAAQPDGQVIPIQDLPRNRALRGEVVKSEWLTFRNATGKNRSVLASAAPLWMDGHLRGAVGVWHDITALEQAQQVRDRLIAILESTPDLVATIDADGQILYVNQAARRILGIADDADLAGSNLFQAYPDWAAALIQETGVPTAIQDGTWWGRTAVLNTRQQEIPMSQVILAHKSADGRLEYLSTIARDVTWEEEIIAQLETEQARLKAIIDNAPVAITVADEQARVLLTNRLADQLHRRPLPYGQPFESHAQLGLCYPDGTPYDPRDLPLCRSALDGLTLTNVDMVVVWPDGQKRDLLVNSTPIRDAKGQISGAIGTFEDVTERKRTREALRRYADHLHLMREVDQAILAARSVQEIADAVLPRARQLLPCRRVSVTLFEPETDEALLLGVDAEGETALRQGLHIPVTGIWPLEQMKRGQAFVVEDVAALKPKAPFFEQLCQEEICAITSVPLIVQGELIGAFNLDMGTQGRLPDEQMDIAWQLANQLAIGIQQARLHAEVQRRAEELEQSVARRTAALQASEARFRTIFEDSAIGIALLDMSGRILAANPALQKMLGYTAEELTARTFDDLTHPDDVASGHALYEELIAGERNHYYVEKRYLRKDGSTLWVRPTVSLVRKTRAGAQYAIKMVEDLTEQKKTQEALIQSEKLSTAGQLGASLAHEINNPLQSVIGCLGLVEETMAEGGDVSVYLRIAREELRRAARIVAQLRDLHRRAEPGEGVPTDLNALLEEVFLLIRKQLENRGIEIVREEAPEIPPLVLVPDRVRQVFLNLLLNAADAMPQGGTLCVRITASSETETPAWVGISFVDDGVGISPEALERIFEPFYSTKPEGLGLGMYISHRIVQEHRGRIEIQSQLDKGSTVTVWLPM